MMASIFFTERPPRALPNFKRLSQSTLHATRSRFDPKSRLSAGKFSQWPIILSWLPQKQGLCQVVKMSDFWNVIRLLTGKSQASDRAIHDSEAHEIGKQVNYYANFRS